MIDFKKFYKAWFVDSYMNLIPIANATREIATTSGFTVEYNFEDVPDLPLVELATRLLNDLPQGFVFVRPGMRLISNSLEELCKQIGRTDIEFLSPIADIDQAWFEQAKDKYFFNNQFTCHELYTIDCLAKQGRPCGLVGNFPGFQDMSITTKNSNCFHAAPPNWQMSVPYSDITAHLMYMEDSSMFIVPNFSVLLLKAFLKEFDVDRNSTLLRMMTINRFGPVALAIGLLPTGKHDISLLGQSLNYPFYPGLIKREYAHTLLPMVAVHVN